MPSSGKNMPSISALLAMIIALGALIFFLVLQAVWMADRVEEAAKTESKKDDVQFWTEFWTAAGVKYAIALLIVVFVTIVLHWLIKHSRSEVDNRGLVALVIGQDRRVSTSKLQVTLWTYAIFFSLVLLLFYPTGLTKFTEKGLQAEYLILLGSPAAAAVLAKTFTTSQVASGTTPKPEADKDPGLVDGAAQAVSNDEGRTDLFDFQYFLFNVVALLYFFGKFLPQPQKGLPNLPETLVALTGVAAAAYTTKKGLPTNVPTLTGVYPATAAPGEEILIRGKNLIGSSDAKRSFRVSGENLREVRTEQDDVRISGRKLAIKEVGGYANRVRVLFGGEHEQTVQLADVQPPATNEIRVAVPQDAEPGEAAPVTVIRADGIATEELPFEVVAGGPRITAVRPSRIVVGEDREILIDGIGFVETDGQPSRKNAVMLHGRELSVARGNWTTGQVRASVPDSREAAVNIGFAVPSTVELVVYDHEGRRSRPETRVELLEQ
jgi:hypothetical protein